jgi:serine/threonine-protein kinase
MSPEQVLCQDVDGRSDLYSVGVMFYRLLTGKLPFEADTAIGMVQKQISDMPTPARLHRADLPTWAVAIVDRALAKSPADRYQTAEELRKALLDAIHDGAVEAKTLMLPSLEGRARWAAARGPDPDAETSIGAAPPRPAPTEFVVVPRRFAPAAIAGPTPSPTPWATPIAAKAPDTAATPTAIPSDIVPPVATVQSAPAPKPLQVARTSGSSRAATRAAVALIAVATLVMVVVAWRRSLTPAPAPSASAETAVSSPAAAPPPTTVDATPAPPAAEPTSPPATPALAPTSSTPVVDTAGRTSSTTPPAGTRPPRAARGTAPPPPEPPPAPAPAPAEPPPPIVVATTPPKPVVAPVQFRAKVLVKEDDKSRERDATVRLAEGQVTVTGSDRAIVGALPYEAVLSVI